MDAIKNLLGSEKGLLGLALIAAVTVLVGLGHVTVEQWIDYTKWIFGFYVAGKTAQGVAAVMADAKVEAAKLTPSPTPSITAIGVAPGSAPSVSE